MASTAEQIGDLLPNEEAEIRLRDGTAVAGTVAPIDFTPEERLYLELQSDDEDVRYRITAEYADGGWTTPTAERYEYGGEWVDLGEVAGVERSE